MPLFPGSRAARVVALVSLLHGCVSPRPKPQTVGDADAPAGEPDGAAASDVADAGASPAPADAPPDAAADAPPDVSARDVAVASPNVCVPGEKMCGLDGVPRSCSEAGQWVKGNPCSAPTNGAATCINGSCDFTCNGPAYRRCGQACCQCVQASDCAKMGNLTPTCAAGGRCEYSCAGAMCGPDCATDLATCAAVYWTSDMLGGGGSDCPADTTFCYHYLQREKVCQTSIQMFAFVPVDAVATCSFEDQAKRACRAAKARYGLHYGTPADLARFPRTHYGTPEEPLRVDYFKNAWKNDTTPIFLGQFAETRFCVELGPEFQNDPLPR